MTKTLVTRLFDPRQKRVNQLRGGPALELLMRNTIIGAVIEISNLDMYGGVYLSSNGVVFLDLSLAMSQNQISFVSDLVNKHRVMVDVHFPVLDPVAAWAFGDDGVISEDGTHKVIDFWSQPEIQIWVKDLLSRVPVITTPHLDTYKKLLRLNRNVVLLPDVTSKRTALRFCKQFCWAMGLAVSPKLPIRARFNNWIRFNIGWPVIARGVRKNWRDAVTKD